MPELTTKAIFKDMFFVADLISEAPNPERLSSIEALLKTLASAGERIATEQQE